MNSQTFNISLPKDLVTLVDSLAKKEFKNRSEFIREALVRYAKDQLEWEEIYKYSQSQATKLGITTDDQVLNLVNEYRSGH